MRVRARKPERAGPLPLGGTLLRSAPHSRDRRSAPGPPADGLTDPNVTAEALLAGMPHVPPDIVSQLVAGRPSQDMLRVDMLLADSLDNAQREEVYARLFARLDLNAASEAEILLIPGVDDWMAHELEEYRPDAGIDQFRREIGHYVDEAEVARLEQYVRIEWRTASRAGGSRATRGRP